MIKTAIKHYIIDEVIKQFILDIDTDWYAYNLYIFKTHYGYKVISIEHSLRDGYTGYVHLIKQEPGINLISRGNDINNDPIPYIKSTDLPIYKRLNVGAIRTWSQYLKAIKDATGLECALRYY